MRARMRDVAQRAGVSPKTVSNVVNGYVHVSAGLRTRVLDAISELNYVPNTSARNLRTGRTCVLALALPDLSVAYFAELARHVTAAATATRHLVRLRRRRIASVGSQAHRKTGKGALRLEGYFAALADAGLPQDDAPAVPTRRLHRTEGVQAMDQLLDLPDPPDAVVCSSDLVALGALHTLRRRGLRVPADVAVVGFDDIEESAYADPTLTTIPPDKVHIARTAVDLLVRRLHGSRTGASRDVLVDFELIERESTQGPTTSRRRRGRPASSARR